MFVLSEHINEQLQDRCKETQVSLTFRKIKVTESVSRASITILDFHCAPQLSPLSIRVLDAITGTVVMSEVPEMHPKCIWSHLDNKTDMNLFSMERAYLLSALPSNANNLSHKVHQSVAASELSAVYKRLRGWNWMFDSTEAAIQRACAWGIVNSASDMFEYRLFAACVTRFFETHVTSRNRPSRNHVTGSQAENENDLAYILTPFIEVFGTDISYDWILVIH